MTHRKTLNSRRAVCLCIVLIALFFLPAFGAGTARGEVYEFGAMFPMTGPAAFIGELFMGAVNQAVDEINAVGGIDGVPLKAVVEDHQGAAKPGADAMNKITLNKNIAYTLGSFVEPNLSAQPIAARNHVIIMNSGGQADSLLNLPYLYNNHVMGGYQMPPLAKYVYAKGFRRVATIIQNNPEGVDNRAAFVRVWKKLGGTVVADEVFDVMDMDFATQLTKIKAAKPDVIYMCAVALQASTILKQKKELGITAQMCGPWIEDPATLMPAGHNADGAISICTYLDYNTPLPFGRNFIINYNEKYAPKGATAYWPWANAYENIYIYAELVRRVKANGGNPRNGELLLKALQDNPEFKSVFGAGKLRFTEDHQVRKDLSINLIEDGKPVTVEVIPYTELKKE